MKKIFNNIKNQKGAALASVIIVFAVVAVLATATATTVIADTKLSVNNEKYNQAYYLARSSVDTVATAITDYLDENYPAYMNDINDAMDAIVELNANPPESTDEYLALFDEYEDDLIAALNAYNDFTDDVVGVSILPSSGSFTHTLNTGSGGYLPPVTITPVIEGGSLTGYKLTATADVDGISATAALRMFITNHEDDSPITVEKLIITTETVEGSETTTTTEEITLPTNEFPGFNSAIYSRGNVTASGNYTITGSPYPLIYCGKDINISGNVSMSGTIEYGGTKSTSGNGFNSIIFTGLSTSVINPGSNYGKNLLPMDVDTLPQFQSNQGTLPSNIDTDDSGYYGTASFSSNKTFNINTSGGDVVLRFDQLSLSGNCTFNVSGNNKFYIYITDTNTNGPGITCSGNFTLNSSTYQTMIIIDQPASDNDSSKNNYNFFSGNSTFKGYIYAPYANLTLPGNFTLSGAVIVNNIIGSGNATINYHKPANSDTYNNNADGTVTITQTTVTTESSTGSGYGSETEEITIGATYTYIANDSSLWLLK